MYIYIYKTYSLLILKFAGGFPYMVWKLDLHRDSTKPQKNRGLDFAPKKVTFKNNGGDLPRGAPRVRTSKLVGKPWGQRKSQGKTNGDFRGKIPGPNVALERWRPYKRPWVFFGLKPTEASPLETNQVRPPETRPGQVPNKSI